MANKKFIDIEELIKSKNPKLIKWLPRFIIRYLKRILHQDEVNDFLEKNKECTGHEFCENAVNFLQINSVVKGIENIPTSGRIIIAMNHPLGGMDAVAFIDALKNRRRDLKFIVNDLLMHLTNLRSFFVGVNKHGKNEKSTRNQVIELFQSENAICLFPAGLVSRKKNGIVEDLEWKKTFMTYALKYDIPIIPVHIDGQLSPFFYRLSNVRSKLKIKANIEMLYLADELFKQKNKTITFTIGNPISVKDLDTTKKAEILANEIKEKVYQLKSNHGKNN